MFPLLFDPTIALLIPALVLAGWAQWKVRSAYSEFSRVASRGGRSGSQVAQAILASNGLGSVRIEAVPGQLSDHYDPKARTVRLSEGNFASSSIAAVSVAAHEVGHAMQHGSGYFPLQFRHAIFPVANLGSTLAFPLFLIGFLAGLPVLVDLGILFFAAAVVFSVVTLPVEFNASRRALAQLRDGRLLSVEELGGAKKVLDAAALTYVAATTMAILQLVRLLLIRGRND
jgi:hypothetical protein